MQSESDDDGEEEESSFTRGTTGGERIIGESGIEGRSLGELEWKSDHIAVVVARVALVGNLSG
jgi:hypothetical protein